MSDGIEEFVGGIKTVGARRGKDLLLIQVRLLLIVVTAGYSGTVALLCIFGLCLVADGGDGYPND